MTNTGFNRRIHSFFSEYVSFIPEIHCDNNDLAYEWAIQESAELILGHKVFLSIRSMKLQALRDYSIILPDWIFENIKKE